MKSPVELNYVIVNNRSQELATLPLFAGVGSTTPVANNAGSSVGLTACKLSVPTGRGDGNGICY